LGTKIDHSLSASAVLGVYPYNGGPYPPLVCPLPDFVRAQLDTFELERYESPLEALEEMGYSLAYSGSANLDLDPQDELVVVLALSEPQLVVFDSKIGKWHAHRAARISSQFDALDLALYDQQGDQVPELIVAARLSDPPPDSIYTDCWQPGAGSTTEIIAVRQDGSGFQAYRGYTACGQPAVLEQSVQDGSLAAGLSEGYHLSAGTSLGDVRRLQYALSLEELQARSKEWKGVYLDLEQLEARIRSQKDPNGPAEEIASLLVELSQGPPGTERLRCLLRYLSGLNAELSGDQEAALKAYLELIRLNPVSPWSWLALARLGP
jgi:hypothetical protein